MPLRETTDKMGNSMNPLELQILVVVSQIPHASEAARATSTDSHRSS